MIKYLRARENSSKDSANGASLISHQRVRHPSGISGLEICVEVVFPGGKVKEVCTSGKLRYNIEYNFDGGFKLGVYSGVCKGNCNSVYFVSTIGIKEGERYFSLGLLPKPLKTS